MTVLVTVLAVAVAVLALGAGLAWKLLRSANSSIDDATQRIGIPRDKGVSRAGALTEGVDRVEAYLGRAERERAQLVGSLESAEFGVMATDDSGIVTFVNPAGSRFVGARHGEAVAEVRLKDLLEKVILTRSAEVEEMDLYTPMRRVLRLHAAPLEYGVESLGAVVFVEDVTEQRRVDAIRRDFIANVGHELKTPLGALSVLAETIADTDDAPVRERLADRLSGEANRIASLVDDILDLSQVESFAAAPEPIAINEVITEATAQVQLAADETGIDVFVEPVQEGVFVSGDRRQLVAALTNLVDNSVKYTSVKEDGFGKVRVRVTTDERWVSVEVRDEGIGIPESHLDRIFERFYRVDKARSRRTGGTGLGLAIVRHVALNHGGEISVASEEGKGSTFTLRLPLFKR